MKYKITNTLFLTLISLSVFSLNTNDEVDVAKPMMRMEVSAVDSAGNLDTFLTYPDDVLDEIFAERMDSLMNNWYVKNSYNIDSVVFPDEDYSFSYSDEIENTNKKLPDSVYIERLAALNSFIDLSYNETVKDMIYMYTERRKKQMGIMLGLANYYFPMFEETLDKYNLPLELKYMAIIESALNARAFSKAGAAGLWQFMYGTGKMYNLEVNSFVDERRDPIKSTEAAAKFLSDLYAIYNDWHLVIAAYNCGPGNVNKAIKRSGGKRDYWTIYYRLPKETRGYVPAFISATYAMNYYKLHGITPQEPSFNLITDTLMINNYLHFDQISSQLNLEIELLRDLNPMYRKDVIPATSTKAYPLVLPQDASMSFIEFEDMIFNYKRDVYFPNNQIKNPNQTAYHYVPVDVKGKDKVFYKVKTGDNVGYISEWFDVRTSDIRYWNNLKGNMIKVGQRLVIYVPQGKADQYSKITDMSFDEKQGFKGTKSATTSQANTSNIRANVQPKMDGTYEYYTVRKGDNLWVIAKNYPGVSAENIQELNNISNSRGLYIGQKLKIRKL